MANPKYPVYIVSKGRWQRERRLTNRVLERIDVPHFIVVEEQEADAYRAVVNPELCTILILDPVYQKNYDTCDNRGAALPVGAGAARNFVWDHSIASGHSWHWVMDDNIRDFYRLNRNKRRYIGDGTHFAIMEEFVERYTSIAMAGPNYVMFAPERDPDIPPFVPNTRIYSCNLIRNDIPFRWRGRYNEDTILSLDILKAGWCTIQFNAFLQQKTGTQRIKGGNTDELYREGTKAKSQMLVDLHPDVARMTWKFQRWHHHVDYRPFRKNRLIRRQGIKIPTGVNEHGMQIVPASRDVMTKEQNACMS